MTTARDVMTVGCHCVSEDDSLTVAATAAAEHDIGALPVYGRDNVLKGMITDRDIVVRCVAKGIDPKTMRVGDLAMRELVWVNADASIDEVAELMANHKIRRVPVMADGVLVGIISQADVARRLPDKQVGGVVAAISDHQ